MSEMVERVAAAIEHQMNASRSDCDVKEQFELLARAAITAMKDPSEEVRTVLCASCSDNCFHGCGCGDVWNAGIDEALK